MKVLGICSALFAVVMFSGCSEEKSNSAATETSEHSASLVEEFLSAEEKCEKWLDDHGMVLGVDLSAGGRILALGACDAEVNQFGKWGISREHMMNIISREAFLEAIKDIGNTINTGVLEQNKESKDSRITLRSTADVTGAYVAYRGVSYEKVVDCFSVAVVMCYDPRMAKRLKARRISGTGKFNISEWIGRQDILSLIGTRYYCDKEGRGWLVAGCVVCEEKGGSGKFWQRKAEQELPYSLAGEVESSMIRYVKRGHVSSDETFEDCYHGEDGVSLTVFGETENVLCDESRIRVTPFSHGATSDIVVEREGLSPVDGSRLKVVVVASELFKK